MYMCLYTWSPSGLFYLESLGNLEVDPCWKKFCPWGLDWKGYSLTHCLLCAAEISSASSLLWPLSFLPHQMDSCNHKPNSWKSACMVIFFSWQQESKKVTLPWTCVTGAVVTTGLDPETRKYCKLSLQMPLWAEFYLQLKRPDVDSLGEKVFASVTKIRSPEHDLWSCDDSVTRWQAEMGGISCRGAQDRRQH